MRGFGTAVLSAAFGTVALCAGGGAVIAGPVTEAGETAGLALGTPLPEGVYFLDTASYISRSTKPETDILVNIPVVAYSTPWKVLGGRVEAYAAVPQLAVGTDNSWSKGMYNPALLVGMAWDLGHGWGFSNFIGGYAPVHNSVGVNAWTFNERAALTYADDGWNLTAHGIYGTSTKDRETDVQVQPDYFNLDLTATKAFGKWELGAVGFGTWDTSSVAGSKRTSSIAAGPFVGYNFGPLSLHTYVTEDIAESHRGGDDTRVFVRLVVPLGTP